MSTTLTEIRACYTPGKQVKFDPGWSVENDPCKDQQVEVFDYRNNKAIVLVLKEKGLEVEIFDFDPETKDFTNFDDTITIDISNYDQFRKYDPEAEKKDELVPADFGFGARGETCECPVCSEAE